MDVIDKKCMPDIILKRHAARKIALEKRQDDKNQNAMESEKIDVFTRNVDDRKAEIERCLAHASTLSTAALPAYFDDISNKILGLQKYVAASNIFLRTYDVKVGHANLHDLTARAKTLEEQLLPKKKFGFSHRNKSKATKPVDEVDAKTSINARLTENFCGFADLTDQTLRMDSNLMDGKDVTLKNLTNCTVKLCGNASTLHVTRLRNCLIFVGPVSTSVFVADCAHCHLVVACQQLRVHNSKALRIYLHVTSRAIIEDCARIEVAPYNWRYEGIERDFAASGLDRETNNWDLIDDFNWLNAERRSPNWSILSEAEREEDWSDVDFIRR